MPSWQSFQTASLSSAAVVEYPSSLILAILSHGGAYLHSTRYHIIGTHPHMHAAPPHTRAAAAHTLPNEGEVPSLPKQVLAASFGQR
jgi:hypothetical protein